MGDIELRRSGEYTTMETRAEAHESVDKKRRCLQILECLRENGSLTAKECAVIMMQKGYVTTSDRGWCAPRMTEMSHSGIIEPIGKKKCVYTGKKVAVYQIREEWVK
jgi:hypothetical protein